MFQFSMSSVCLRWIPQGRGEGGEIVGGHIFAISTNKFTEVILFVLQLFNENTLEPLCFRVET